VSYLVEVTWEQILAGMIAELTPVLNVDGTDPTKYLRQLDVYVGQFEGEEGMVQGGIAGRTPAVLVDLAGEKSLHSTVARNFDHVEGTFLAICATDVHRTRKDRERLFAVMRDVRRRLGGRRLGLQISGLRYDGLVVVAERPQLLAYGVKFTTRYHVDLTRSTSNDLLLETTGTITNTDEPPKTIGGLDQTF